MENGLQMESVLANLLYYGAQLSGKKVAILNSHHNKTPVGNDAWVQATVRAIDDSIRQGWVVLASTDVNTYEFILWYAGSRGAKIVVVMPIFADEDIKQKAAETIRQFGLCREQTGFLFFPVDLSRSHYKKLRIVRDNLIMKKADIIIPISINPKGKLKELLRNYIFTDTRNDFTVDFKEKGWSIPVLPALDSMIDIQSEPCQYLTHWTHTRTDGFPDETKAAYYEAVFRSGDDYARDAFQIMRHILSVKRIVGSTEGMRDNRFCVAFTQNDPKESMRIVRWQAGHSRYTFEPYGIAVRRDALEKLGSRAVIYGEENRYERLSATDKPFFQYRGQNGCFEPEKEWRLIGDFEMLNPDEIIVYVRSVKEKMALHAEFPQYRIESLWV